MVTQSYKFYKDMYHICKIPFPVTTYGCFFLSIRTYLMTHDFRLSWFFVHLLTLTKGPTKSASLCQLFHIWLISMILLCYSVSPSQRQ
ncbi:hypothetical protein GDO81_013628 [Engystomops pustulosus]|uniref:Uncharacterized protein n=1 Tax=Engystomops pustulosus TaxID=76066 RepID=A0AAV7B0W8_ENGPU|nr:hypothetical protein GDO81_013628 [Engystomops pustulosus]